MAAGPSIRSPQTDTSLEPLSAARQAADVISLEALLAGGRLGLTSAAPQKTMVIFLPLAVALAAALQEFHQRHGRHGAISPAAIMLPVKAPASADFSDLVILDPQQGERRLAFIAPEQTGRIGRAVDKRADLYALGVILFQLLTGELPFQASDPLALVYAHLATNPLPPAALRPDLPLPISDIVLKLLAKDPTDRYQSAHGLRADLQRCLESEHVSERFPLGDNDISETLLLPQGLYGRECELKRLLSVLDEARNGTAQLLFLSGESGIGKTALASKLLQPATALGGTFIYGRAEEQERDASYGLVIGALTDFVRQLVTGDQERLNHWLGILNPALVGNAGPLLPRIPELALLLETPAIATSDGSDLKILLGLSLQNFIRAIARPDHPLVVFLDDVQWADTDSLELLQTLAARQDLCLLVVCACRLDAGAPAALEQLIASLPIEQHLALAPLDGTATERFVADGLQTTPGQVAELAALLQGKTRGNAFFLREFLLSLHDQSLLSFDLRRRSWQWDMARIRATPISDNVVDLVRGRLQQLPSSAQKTLRVAAMLGSQCELGQLAAACQLSLSEASRNLNLALELDAVLQVSWNPSRPSRAGLPSEPRLAAMRRLTGQFLFPSGEDQATGSGSAHQAEGVRNEAGIALALAPARHYAFAHEQIRQAALGLLPDLTQEALHEQIGRGLLKGLTPAQRQAHIFLLVRHLNQAPALCVSWPDCINVAELNLEAARQALALVAYENAFALAQAGLAALNADARHDAWVAAYSLSRALHVTAAEAATRNGQFEMAERFLVALDEHASSVLERAATTQVRMFGFYLQGRHAEAVATAVKALRELGVRLPEQPRNRHVFAELVRMQLALLGRGVGALEHLAPMTGAHNMMAMEIMAAASVSAASADPALFALIGLEMLRQTLRHGAHPLSAVGYALYGVLLCSVTRQIARGYAFGQLALGLVPEIRSKEHRVFVKYFVHAHIKHWKEPVKATLQPLRDLATTGEFEYLAVAAGLYPYFTWFLDGLEVDANERAIAENMYLLEPFRGTPLYYRYQYGQQYYRNLLGRTRDPCLLVGDVYDERQLLPLHQRENDRTTIFFLACHKLILCLLFEEYEEGRQAAQMAVEYSDGGLGTPLIPVLAFYHCLTELARVPSKAATLARPVARTIASYQRNMRRWARHAPANCLHRYTLVEAELARIRGDDGRARELYDAAVSQARQHDYLPELAVAHEVAARFFLAGEQPAYAEMHLQAAHSAYRRWGATGKVKQLESRHPALRRERSSLAVGPSALSDYMDMTSALRAAQVLAGETDLPRLVETLTRILIENAGAQHGHLLLPDAADWRVAARGAQGEAGDETGLPPSTVAMSIVRQVAHTREPLSLNDAQAMTTHMRDPHLQAIQPKSILCLPLLHKGELVAVFYMENRLVGDAFPPERLDFLTTLASQAATALQNAQLVAALQETQEQVQASEARFRLLFQNAPLGIFEIDISGETPVICAANRRAEATYGWSAAEMATLDPADLIPVEARGEIQRLVDAVRAGKTAVLETTNRRQDGTLFPVRIIATPVGEQGGASMIVAVEDITAQRQRRSEVEAIDEERRRIAQEIHDGVAQDLASLRLKTALWADWIAADPPRMQVEVDQTRETLDGAIEEIRRAIYALRPLALDEVGLLPALRRYIAEFNDQHEVYVDLQIELAGESLPANLELPLFRVAQEALNNTARHAGASLAWVRLAAEEDVVTLHVRDNGHGFDDLSLEAAPRQGHLGLKQMRERIEEVGGILRVSSEPGHGTEIVVRLPLR